MIRLRTMRRAFPHAGVFLYALGLLFLIIGLCCLTPLVYLLFDGSERAWAPVFLAPAGGLVLAGTLFVALCHRHRRGELTLQIGGVIVAAAWIVAFLASSYPIQQLAGLTFSQAMFEAVSGWTTTGLSVVDVQTAPDLLLLWRSIMQLAGGAGLAIIMLAVFSLPVGAGLYRAEGRTSQLAPHVLASTRLVVLLYSGYAVVGVVAYRLAGMSWFDAVNHSFTAVSTGGFSTRAASIGHWDSPAIEAVSVPLMILGNLNFLTAYLLFQGKPRAFFRNGEIRTGFVLLVVGALVVFFVGTGALYPSADKRIRVAIFETVTALTTTGFSTVGYTDWPAAGFLVLIVLMLAGGGTCSTAGGIKKLRIFILFKSLLWEVQRTLLPRRAVVQNSIWQGEDRVFVSDRMLSATGSFLFLYLSVWIAGSLVVASFGYDLGDSLFEFASSVGTVGLSVGVTGPKTPVPVLWAEILGMFLGRLEFFIVFVAVGNVAGGVGRAFKARR
jgi:trk system potassium uptake protein TrkH